MALFGKKKEAEFCALCGKERKGGILLGMFQSSVDGHYVCNDCYGDVDVSSDILHKMTVEDFKSYCIFRENNKKLKEKFTITNTIDFGTFDDKIVFDHKHRLMCMNKRLNKTIFESGSIASFVIREDDKVIFEGCADGLNTCESDVCNEISLMRTAFADYQQDVNAFNLSLLQMEAEQREAEKANVPKFNSPEPFQDFYVELNFNHPYWTSVTLDMKGPRFTDKETCLDDYLTAYRLGFDTMKQLADELMYFAFSAAGTVAPSAEPALSQKDIAEALIKLKQLLDMGVITEEEFSAKKNHLLGM